MTSYNQPIWTPTQNQVEQSLLWKFMRYVRAKTGKKFTQYSPFYSWSIQEKETFWSLFWDFGGIIGHRGQAVLHNGDDLERAVWFPEAQLNFAENLLRRQDEAIAIYFRAEDRIQYRLSYRELYQQVRSIRSWLKNAGIKPGDRVAGYLPNIPEAVIAMLATASLGAVWTSTSPDFGEDSVLDRFSQTSPSILFCSDGYVYNGKTHDLRQRVEKIMSSLPSITHCAVVPYVGTFDSLPGTSWQEIVNYPDPDKLHFHQGSFNAPLYILYSSGTTGRPKCITHKVGGALLQHTKEHQLHCNIQPDDHIFYYTTCGWMMWNWLVSALASRAGLVLYDGSPFYPDDEVLWRYAQKSSTSLFGTSAKYLDTIKKRGVTPKDNCDLTVLRTICSTGSVLAPESFDYVYEAIKEDVQLASISGGTDLVSCFVLGCPILPVYRGECQCRGLGMAVEVFNSQGKSVVEEKGELVCTSTFPSQPLYFWNDPKGEKYHNAYFTRYSNVWHHGDYVELTKRQSMVIYGRSDATLNPGGIRIGTAEIYRHVEQLTEVVESIVIGQEFQDDIRIILFVVLQPHLQLDDSLKQTIIKTVKEKCSPHHIPARIIQVPEIPRTKSGKIVELAVREVIHDKEVKNIGSLANPEALDYYRNLTELQK